MSIRLRKEFEPCEESLSNTNKIQPFAALIRIQRANGIISHASDNINEYLPSDKILGEHINTILPKEACDAVSACQPGEPFNYNADNFSIIGHSDEAGWTLEFELNQPHSINNSLIIIKSSIGKAAALNQTLTYLSHHSDFDRVLYFEFLPDGSGFVKGEIFRQQGEEYLNLRYPATDIPKVARDLYMKSKYRFIHDTQAQPIPVKAHTHSELLQPDSLDLSMAFSRNVSPFHIEYMRNMGIRCALSLPVIIQQKLVGLFSLHHSSPLSITHKDRTNLAIAAKSYALYLAKTESEDNMAFIERHHRLIHTYCNWMLLQHEYNHQLQDVFKKMMGAKEAAFNISNQWYAKNTHQDFEFLNVLANSVWQEKTEGIFMTDCLAQSRPELGDIPAKYAGVICVWFFHAATQLKVTLIFTKPEIIQEVTWGSKVEFYPGKINPVNSFGRWREAMSEHSEPWNHSAKIIANSILKIGSIFSNDQPLFL